MCFIPDAINNSLYFTDLAVFGFFSKALKKFLDSTFYNHKSSSPNLAPSFFMAISVEIVFICATISISTWQVRFRITRHKMYLVHWSEMEKVQRYSGVFAASPIPPSLTFGPYKGTLNIFLKTNDHKHLDYILEVRCRNCF